MAKLEQLSELLVAEISQFKKTVGKLETIQQQKIAIETRATNLYAYVIAVKFEKIILLNF